MLGARLRLLDPGQGRAGRLPGRDRLYPDPEQWLNEGDSVVVSPLGEIVAGPLHAEHGILVADVDASESRAAHYTLDAAGHYNRPDVFSLRVNRAPAQHVAFDDAVAADVHDGGAPPGVNTLPLT